MMKWLCQIKTSKKITDQINVQRNVRQGEIIVHCIIHLGDALGSKTNYLNIHHFRTTFFLMNTYPESEYPNLYEEILKDHNFRFGKFNPIPYPNMADKTQPIVIDWSKKGANN